MANSIRTHILVCTGGGCIACGSLLVSAAFRQSLRDHQLDGEIKVVESGCLGPCSIGPVVVIYPDGVFYENVKPADAEEIVTEHMLKGRPVKRLCRPPIEHVEGEAPKTGFLDKQVKIVLRNCGLIDPRDIEEYIAVDGYEALARAVTELTPDDIIETMKKSGVRGRGGAGFPAGLKWAIAKKSTATPKYVLCNGDEGDPGAFMDRSLLEGDPHSIIEGMAIAGRAIGSSHGIVYVRAEYPLAVERLGHAIKQAHEYGLLGENILGSDFSFDLEIRMGAGAFVCGEETALMTSIEGKRGEPRPRPPYPADRGLWGKPSLLNNVETYANVAAILVKGPEWFASYGTAKSKGTKVFALAGTVENTGLVEVPIGTPLGEIVFDVGGGIPKGKAFKAAQIGGPSGGCIPRQNLEVPVDYESLQELGAIMGSGGLVVMDEDSCMPDVARFFLEFVREESCGKCTPCRVGTKRMLEIVTRICEGKGEMKDLDDLEALGETIRQTALCGLGQTAPNPLLSTLRHFRDEYIAHIRDKRCPAGVCADLVRSPCQNACPAGVNVAGYVSLIGEKRYEEALRLHRENNPFAGVCARVCFHPCESKCRRGSLDESVSIRGLKRFMADAEGELRLPSVQVDEANAARKVAVVGAGPAGLSCAYFLARLGYRPVVFESTDRPGGLLLQAIPSYRLPRNVIDSEVAMIEKLGVTIKTGQRLGKNITLSGLREQGYEAVFLGIGAPLGTNLGLPGEDSDGVVDAMQFLRDFNLTGTCKVGKSVVVVGGGNSAVDAARTAVRLGAETVTIVYRRTRDQMPAFAHEVLEAEKEGVRIRFLLGPAEVVVKNGKATGLKCTPMELKGFDRAGRRRAVPSEKGSVVVPADQIITAIGQKICVSAFAGEKDQPLGRDGFVKVDPLTGQTDTPWLFAGGDAVTGPASVVEAVRGGEVAAVAIDSMLRNATHAFWREHIEVNTHFDPDGDPSTAQRTHLRLLEVEKRKGCFDEVELPWIESDALLEATRCLRCDYRETCK